jgi:hypothetical protein
MIRLPDSLLLRSQPRVIPVKPLIRFGVVKPILRLPQVVSLLRLVRVQYAWICASALGS